MLASVVLITAMLLSLAVCQAQCQSTSFSPDSVQTICFYGSNPPEGEGHYLRTPTSLVDAPPIRPATQGQKFQIFLEDSGSPLTLGVIGIDATVMHSAEEEHLAAGRQTGLAAL